MKKNIKFRYYYSREDAAMKIEFETKQLNGKKSVYEFIVRHIECRCKTKTRWQVDYPVVSMHGKANNIIINSNEKAIII